MQPPPTTRDPAEPFREREPIVVLEDFTVRYGKFTAVDRASFKMPHGACGLLGQNGAGKSSILKAVLGLVRPAGGSARVAGFDAVRDGLALRDHVGYMPEKEAFLPGLSGLDSVILAGRLSGLPKGVAKQRAHEVLWLVGLDEARYRDVAGYSLGMKQKVKLAMALVHDAQLLFLDEPTNGLDPEGRAEILALLRDVVRVKNKSLILSSHILADVEAICEHAVLIDHGRIVAQGSIDALTRGVARSYDVRAEGAVDAFERRLREAALLVDVVAPVDGHDVLASERASLQVQLAEGQGTEIVFELARSVGANIRRFEPKRRTMSDVFLETVRANAGVRA
ncbi:MAG TPA: ABC transporter ATP-binding protein [Planctomycetota bacterium]|nr:ABC transporter ATP-binding protein [Planctomycetota bacterium]